MTHPDSLGPKPEINYPRFRHFLHFPSPHSLHLLHILQFFAADLRGTDEKRKHLSLLCVGELGQQTDLGTKIGLKPLFSEVSQTVLVML